MSLKLHERPSDPPYLARHSRTRYLNEPNFQSAPISTECDNYLALPSEHLSSKRSGGGTRALIFFFPQKEIIRKSASVQTFGCVISLFMVGIPLLAFDL